MKDHKKQKKGTAPSKEDADLAMKSIKALQAANDENIAKKRIQEEELARVKALEEANKIQILLAQEKINRKLRENIKRKKEEKRNNKIRGLLEAAVKENSKIKWKSTKGGKTLEGYVGNKLYFEITRGLTLFSLYIKNKKILEGKKMQSYQGCSTNIYKLKDKSNKLI